MLVQSNILRAGVFGLTLLWGSYWITAMASSEPAASAIGDSTALEVVYRRGYVDSTFGQVHYHVAMPRGGTTTALPVVLFHQTPKSAWEYEFLLRELGKDRVAIAVDTPGYGESDRPPEPQSIESLAEALATALDALSVKLMIEQFDVFGFHTGAFLATELALQRPLQVRGVVLSGLAYRSASERAELLNQLPVEFEFPSDASRLMDRWQRMVVDREEGVSKERAMRVFLEDIHSLGYWWYAYVGVWNYPIAEKLVRLKGPVLILQPHEMLLEETRRIHREVIPSADYIELPDVQHPVRVFETGSRSFAHALRAWLDVLD